MLKSISLSNVRNFVGGPWKFELSELTALCGANSAGKSTLIKSLLLLRANSKGPLQAERLGRVQFSDEDFDLGDFRSFVSNNNTRKPFSIELEYTGQLPKVAFKAIQKFIPQNLRSETESPTPYALNALFRFMHVDTTKDKRHRKNKNPRGADSGPLGFGCLESATFTVSLFEQEIATLVVYLTNAAKSSFPFPIDKSDEVPYLCRLSKDFFDATGAGRLVQPLGVTANGSEVQFTPALNGIFPAALIGISRSKSSQTTTPNSETKRVTRSNREFVPFSLPPILRSAIDDLREFLDQMDYTAPLRAHAKRFYFLNQEHSAGSDSSGESIPYLLRDNLERKLSVCLPQSSTAVKSITFKSALNSWIRYLRDETSKHLTNDEININFYRGLIGDITLRRGRKAIGRA